MSFATRTRVRKRAPQPRREYFFRASRSWEKGELRSAFRLFLFGARAGDASCQHGLGYFYDVGIGVRRNSRKALYWYMRAYRRGSQSAPANIGTMFRDNGEKAKAARWFQRAIRRGDVDSNLDLGKLWLESGKPQRASRCFEHVIRSSKAAVASQEEAQELLERLR